LETDTDTKTESEPETKSETGPKPRPDRSVLCECPKFDVHFVAVIVVVVAHFSHIFHNFTRKETGRQREFRSERMKGIETLTVFAQKA